MKKQFHYVVAKPWKEDDPDNLCIYCYIQDVQFGNIKNAKAFLNYVNKQSDASGSYSIYKVKYEKVT